MNEKIQIIFGLLGGLAIFIYGMNMMSECLQKAAGEKMKSILALLTKNPVLGVLAGALTTAVLQSSSATTVMAIGFVSAKLMTLPQAISIILGANIGTTMTAQIIAFKITDYIYLFVFAGFLVNFIAKSQKIKNIGLTIFAFGLLFLGIETMGTVMKPLASSSIFTDMIAKVSNLPVLGVVVGTLMTLVVQSSSATIAVLQNFASQADVDGVTSILGLTGALPILFGDNIGTTITALLASVGQSKDAKRTAVAHCVFNISGCLLFIGLIKPFAQFIQWISPKGNEVDVIARQIANAHTTFNVVMTIIWIPLIWLLVKIVMFLIPDKKGAEQKDPTEPLYLDNNLLLQPVPALQLVTREVLHCSEVVGDMLKQVEDNSKKQEDGILEYIVEKEQIVCGLGEQIHDYLSHMFVEGVLTEEQAEQATGMMYVLCDVERISLLCREITETIVSQNKKQHKFSKEALKELKNSMQVLSKMYEEAMQIVSMGETAEKDVLQEYKKVITDLDSSMRTAHMERVGKGECSAKLTITYNALLHMIERMGNSCINLADSGIVFQKTLDNYNLLML